MIFSTINKIVFLSFLSCLLYGSMGYAQTDSLKSKNKKQVLFVSAGLSMPLSDYANTSKSTAGYAKNGFSTVSTYTNNIYKIVEFTASHLFVINKVNHNALAANIKSNIESQINNTVDYASAKSTNWYSNALLIGPGLRIPLDKNKKLNLYANAQAGIALVNTPSTETLIQIDQLFYSTKVKKSINWAPMYTGNLGVNYLFTPKSGLIFNTNFIHSTVKGDNLDITEVGNNTYYNDKYRFEQKINSLNFTFGISTHF